MFAQGIKTPTTPDTPSNSAPALSSAWQTILVLSTAIT
jgi:hypothetical protein